MKYTSTGKPYMGKTHKMPDGSTHSGATHTPKSRKLFDKRKAK
ncbi:MAG: hypothetical protein VW440_07975 [Bordetella sp.]